MAIKPPQYALCPAAKSTSSASCVDLALWFGDSAFEPPDPRCARAPSVEVVLPFVCPHVWLREEGSVTRLVAAEVVVAHLQDDEEVRSHDQGIRSTSSSTNRCTISTPSRGTTSWGRALNAASRREGRQCWRKTDACEGRDVSRGGQGSRRHLRPRLASRTTRAATAKEAPSFVRRHVVRVPFSIELHRNLNPHCRHPPTHR